MILAVALTLVLQTTGGCAADRLLQVFDDGPRAEPYTLVTEGGRRLTVSGQDFVRPKDWRPGDRLSICSEPTPRTFLRTLQRVTDIPRGETLATSEPRAPAP